jgi:hypothetical protein
MNLVARLALVISLLGAFATWLFRGDLDSPAAFLRCARVCFAQRSHLALDFLFSEGVSAYLLHVSSSRSATRRTATPRSAAEGNATENSRLKGRLFSLPAIARRGISRHDAAQAIKLIDAEGRSCITCRSRRTGRWSTAKAFCSMRTVNDRQSPAAHGQINRA